MEEAPILITITEGAGFLSITYRENQILRFSYYLEHLPRSALARLLLCFPFPFPVPLGTTGKRKRETPPVAFDSIDFREHQAIKNRDHAQGRAGHQLGTDARSIPPFAGPVASGNHFRFVTNLIVETRNRRFHVDPWFHMRPGGSIAQDLM